ncbi:MAG TPA: LEA type 2 family protein [Anaeromyxobacteraceae bacterium]|nr:LEA type 2 family protein [Anaeromyxobacteraceae bacterium]
MRSRTLFLALTLAVTASFLASGCAALGAAARAVVEPPKVAFDHLSLDALDLDGVTLGLNWNVDNPNGFPFRLSRLGWALELDGRQAARGDTRKAIEVPAEGAAKVSIPVRLRWADLPGLVQVAMRRDELPFKVSGVAAVASGFGDIDVPFSREGKVAVPRDFGLSGLSSFGTR